MVDRRTKLALGLAAFHAADAVACGIHVPYIKRDLDRLGCPEKVQNALPAIKGAAALGLLAGLKLRPLGAVTATALVAYFGAAEGFHLRARDPAIRFVPAATIGGLSAIALFAVYR